MDCASASRDWQWNWHRLDDAKGWQMRFLAGRWS